MAFLFIGSSKKVYHEIIKSKFSDRPYFLLKPFSCLFFHLAGTENNTERPKHVYDNVVVACHFITELNILLFI